MTGWPVLALSGGIFLAAMGVIRGVLAWLNRRHGHPDESMTARWLVKHRRSQQPPDRVA